MRSDADGGSASRTVYLPADRTSALKLATEISVASRSAVVEALLLGTGTALAVVDRNRQIVALNAAYVSLLGVDDPSEALGLRPGEAVRCVHARATPGGCGTTPACPSCGAAIAMLVAGRRGEPAERDCCLRVQRDGVTADHVFRARATPLEIGAARFLLLTLADVSADRRRAALQRAFLHDLANLATGLDSAAGALGDDAGLDATIASDIRLMARRLVGEVRLQRALAAEANGVEIVPETVAAGAALSALRDILAHHPAARGRRLVVAAPGPGPTVRTDGVVLQHVVGNMIVNALEATPEGGAVRLSVADGVGFVAFRVWNPGAIPAAVRPRVFQRYFTTKPGAGRGQGTFAMRLFGEEYLGGRVSFETSARDGTTFELRLPAR
ncbi:MAG TPA: sensor histidine kinase [Anaeromyxobacter sp.]|nr:sensor histidine kinase [Anaeromyxobacter sp.]